MTDGRCATKGCVWPAEKNGLCAIHFRDFGEPSRGVSGIAAPAASHVLIHGVAFERKAKEPFVASGVSILGALEYDQETETVRCHECGLFFTTLYAHLAQHGLSARDYRLRHGLTLETALSGPATTDMRRAAWERRGMGGFKDRKAARRLSAKAAVARKSRKVNTGRVSVETLNNRNTCRAQMLFRLQTLAAQRGRTPTEVEMRNSGLDPNSLKGAFGSLRNAVAEAGLKLRGWGVWPSREKSPSREGESLEL